MKSKKTSSATPRLGKQNPRTRRIEGTVEKSIPHLKAPSHHLRHQAEEGEGLHLQQRCCMPYVCPTNVHSNQKARTGKRTRTRNQVMTYYFDVERCHAARRLKGCYKDGAKKQDVQRHDQADFTKNRQSSETESFKELARTRYKIEVENSELKHRQVRRRVVLEHSLACSYPGATTIFVTNLKGSSHWGLKGLYFAPFSHQKQKRIS